MINKEWAFKNLGSGCKDIAKREKIQTAGGSTSIEEEQSNNGCYWFVS